MERVIAPGAAQHICLGIAVDDVRPVVARAVDRRCALFPYTTLFRSKRMAHRSAHDVCALAIELADHVTGVVYEIGVITHAARHPVRSEAAVEQIVALAAI